MIKSATNQALMASYPGVKIPNEFYITQNNMFEAYMNERKAFKEFEEETGTLVYAVTHEIFEFGECYSFLCVSKYK